MLQIQSAALEAIRSRRPAKPQPRVRCETLQLYLAPAGPLFSNLARLLAPTEGNADQSERFAADLQTDRSLQFELLRAAVFHRNELPLLGLQSRSGLSVPALTLLARAAASPLVSAASEGATGNARELKPDKIGVRCPVCRLQPALAAIGDNASRRTVYCSICATPWSTSRLKCLFCGIEVSGKIVTRVIRETPDSWLEACEYCNRCWKAFQTSEGAEFQPLPADVGTLHLELLAERKEWKPPLPYTAVR